MPFVKPHTYIAGTLDASDHTSNEEALKLYVNQEIVAADIPDDSIVAEDIEPGTYNPINNHHDFTSGEVYGDAIDGELVNRAYFTSHVKGSGMVGPQTVVYSNIYGTGDMLHLDRAGQILVSFSGDIVSEENIHEDHGRYDSEIILRYRYNEGPWTNIDGARGYSFEEHSASAGGVRRPLQPDGYIADGKASAGAGGSDTRPGCFTFRRFQQWTWLIANQPAGKYQLSVFVNSKTEQGYVAARSFVAEIFYS